MNVKLETSFESVITPPMTEGLWKKLQLARKQREVREENFERISSYTGSSCLKPEVTEDEIKIFMECVVSDKDTAIELLIINAIVSKSLTKSLSYQLLAELLHHTIFPDYTEEQWVSLFFVLADVTDELTKVSGPVSPSRYRILHLCTWISEDIVRYLAPNKRAKYLLKAIETGKAKSFVVSFMRNILREHKEKNTFWKNFVPFLETSELKKIQERTLVNVKDVLDNGVRSVPDSVHLFLYWFEFGSEEGYAEIRNWIDEHTETDEEFVEFISVFSEKARIRNYHFDSDTVWVVYTDILEMIIGNTKFLDRLKEISRKTNSTGNVARELIGRIEHERKLEEDGLELRKFLHK